MLYALLGLHAVLALAAPPLARRLGRGVFLVCALAPGVTIAYAAANAPAVLGGQELRETLAWAPSLGMSGDLRLDAFALLMVALVSGIGTLIFVYAHGYFSTPRADLGKFAAALTGFAGSMLGLVLADNLLFLFVFWELTSITSYLLIGFDDRKPEARDAALQALLTTGVGGLAMLGGFVVLGQAAGSYSLSALLASPPPADGLLTVGLLLVLAGAFTKSAQVPFHTWLPGAMVAPTPVSAYLHSATMVKAGVYLIARLSPAFADVPGWRGLVVTVGVSTMLVGGYRALRQHDLKLLLAFGTISQLGFMVALFGAGTPQTVFAGCLLLAAHGAFKASLFMVVGIVDHEAHTRDLRRLDGLWRALPLTFATALLAGASMAGVPPLFGFIAKEAALESFLHGAVGSWEPVASAGLVVGSVLTFAYTARFLWGGFASKHPARIEGGGVGRDLHPPPRAFIAPAALLALFGLAFGLVPEPTGGLLNAATAALAPAWEGETIKLWHGLNLALALSALVIATGMAAFMLRGTLERYQDRLPQVLGATDTYRLLVRSVLLGAKRLTGVVQNGSLPVYLSVISLTVVVIPGAVLVRQLWLAEMPPVAAGPIQLVLALVVAVGAVAAAVSRRRLTAVLLLGGVGYAVGLLFVVHGAPDLALTQFLIETLVLVIFVLVLRHLPARVRSARLPLYQAVRGLVAGAVGLFVFAFALVVGSVRRAPSVSAEHLARAQPEGHGANVVNVILVDFRALDTLGEIVVLVVAAVGISSLILAGRLRGHGSSDEPS